MTKRIIIVGAGHNGLVCAAYLARAGREVLVLEANAQVGGAAVTRTFAPGYQVPAVAHLLYGFDPVIERELRLRQHGLTDAKSRGLTVALNPNGAPLVHDGRQVLSGLSHAEDRQAFADFMHKMRRLAVLLKRQHGRTPPKLTWASWRDAWSLVRLALQMRLLGRADMRELLRMITMPMHDVLEESFADDLLKGALAVDAVLGTKLGPRSGNTVLNFLHRHTGASAPRVPVGGMGAVSESLASAARAAGAQIRLGARVAAINIESGRATGVTLASGEVIGASTVVSGADPKTTFEHLVGLQHLEAELARRIHHMRCEGTAAKLHVALRALPQFTGVEVALVGERLLIAPSALYVDEAFNPAKYGEYSSDPILEISIPSIADPTLAPAGHHVLSAIVQYAPAQLTGGWEAQRAAFEARVLAVLERYAPGFGSHVVATELLTPADLEAQFGLRGGHWHHGELTLDQYLTLRPVPGLGHYATPVQALYLCGAGCHPGGGVMGVAGRNAACVILQGGVS